MTELGPLESLKAATPACTRAPVGLLAELTYRCPLQCPYCSNPLEMERDNELSAAEWGEVMRQAGELGVLQVHLSGASDGAPDLEEILCRGRAGLYTNLITSGGRRRVSGSRDWWPGLTMSSLDPRRRSRERRAHLRLQGSAEETRGRPLGQRATSAHDQRGGSPRTSKTRRR
jgi:hypothetical protein